MSDSSKSVYIEIEQLCIGIYIYLDLGWLEHSFTLNNFKIKDIEQIATIKQLGLKKIRIDPERSDTKPLPSPSQEAAVVEVNPPLPSAEENEAAQAKKTRVQRLAKIREAIALCEKQFVKASSTLKNINHNIHSQPKEAYYEADQLVQQMIAVLLAEKDVAIHLMNDKVAGEDIYFHSMNVAVLAMMLAKEIGLSNEEIQWLGVGCLFHDIGKTQIPDRVLLKTEPLTRTEQSLIYQHCGYGDVIAGKMGLPQPVRDIILQHHEYMDGSGYPRQLAEDKISVLARIVAIVNTYDNHCNHLNPLDSLSPYEALSHMFAHQRKLFDQSQLSEFVRCMGVYPPGTLVSLSNQMMGMVVSVNSSKPLRPSVLVYDPAVPKNEAVILDLLDEPAINVSACLKAKQLPPEVYNYLSPRKRVTYFFDASKSKTAMR